MTSSIHSPAALEAKAQWAISAEEKAEISASITQTWTDQAIRCYVTQADCSNCSIPKGNYSFTCQMDKVVPVLIENLGLPDAQRIHKAVPEMMALPPQKPVMKSYGTKPNSSIA